MVVMIQLLMDEAYESERREQMLDAKLEELQRQNPLLPRSKREELHESLLRKNVDIYIQRSKQLGTPRKELLKWTVEGVELRVLADRTLHGRPNVVRFVQSVNLESSTNPDTLDFSTLWARSVELDCASWRIQLSDYPQPYMHIDDGHFFGTLAGAEQTGGIKSTRTCLLEPGAPWPAYQVSRNMSPLKFYYDLCAGKIEA